MAKKYKQQGISDETVAEAMRIAKSQQRPGQTKEQTKLIAQGIQKGIDHYKKLQKTKAGERDRLRKNVASQPTNPPASEAQPPRPETRKAGPGYPWLAWVLLLLTLAGIGAYFLLINR